jgi:hypothetical protein
VFLAVMTLIILCPMNVVIHKVVVPALGADFCTVGSIQPIVVLIMSIKFSRQLPSTYNVCVAHGDQVGQIMYACLCETLDDALPSS